MYAELLAERFHFFFPEQRVFLPRPVLWINHFYILD
jgi:hypothetical protein